MDPYVFAVLERNAQEARVRAAPYTWHLNEVLAERTAGRRSRRMTWLRALIHGLRGHTPRLPAAPAAPTH
jgi:hypothetical protein